MERVSGIGGFFSRAQDPEALNRWYAEHLGVVPPSGSYDDPGWFPDRLWEPNAASLVRDPAHDG